MRWRAMTLIVALVWGPGVLVSADSRASGGLVFHEERKVYPIYAPLDEGEVDLAIAAGAGDAALVKQGFRLIETVFKSWLEGLDEPRNPSSQEVEEIVGEVERRLMARYRGLREMGLEVDASLLLATVTGDGEPRLYVFDSRGLAEPVHENPGYALLGRGVVTGGLLLLRLLDYRPPRAWDWDLGLLSAFIIDVVSEVDPSVSPFLGESYFIRYENGRVTLGPLKEEAYAEYKDKTAKRKELFKLLWTAAEEVGEEEVEKILREALTSV